MSGVRQRQQFRHHAGIAGPELDQLMGGQNPLVVALFLVGHGGKEGSDNLVGVLPEALAAPGRGQFDQLSLCLRRQTRQELCRASSVSRPAGRMILGPTLGETSQHGCRKLGIRICQGDEQRSGRRRRVAACVMLGDDCQGLEQLWRAGRLVGRDRLEEIHIVCRTGNRDRVGQPAIVDVVRVVRHSAMAAPACASAGISDSARSAASRTCASGSSRTPLPRRALRDTAFRGRTATALRRMLGIREEG